MHNYILRHLYALFDSNITRILIRRPMIDCLLQI